MVPTTVPSFDMTIFETLLPLIVLPNCSQSGGGKLGEVEILGWSETVGWRETLGWSETVGWRETLGWYEAVGWCEMLGWYESVG